VEPGILERDRQAQTCSARRARSRRISAPEPVEYQRRLPWTQPDAKVPNRHGDRLVVLPDLNIDTSLTTMLHGIVDEIADDAVNSTRVAIDGIAQVIIGQGLT
jgi:hypothetical protein